MVRYLALNGGTLNGLWIFLHGDVLPVGIGHRFATSIPTKYEPINMFYERIVQAICSNSNALSFSGKCASGPIYLDQTAVGFNTGNQKLNAILVRIIPKSNKIADLDSIPPRRRAT
jgi:hypothetical protein